MESNVRADMIEISIKVSDDDTSLVSKYLSYEEKVTLSHDDVELRRLVNETTAKFKGDAKDILIKIKYTW